jgi:Short C-terminal domain
MGLLILVAVIGSAFWAYSDAKAFSKKGVKIEPLGPAGWFWACLLLWIVFFPWYLVKRSSNNTSVKPTLTRIVEQVSEPLRQSPPPAPASIADELRKFADLKEQGLITEDEYNTQRKRLLGS